MTTYQDLGEQKQAMYSSSDLKQLKDAVRELRASSPGSALADLVEEKIRATVPCFADQASRREGDVQPPMAPSTRQNRHVSYSVSSKGGVP